MYVFQNEGNLYSGTIFAATVDSRLEVIKREDLKIILRYPCRKAYISPSEKPPK
jgi:hypothetical protein